MARFRTVNAMRACLTLLFAALLAVPAGSAAASERPETATALSQRILFIGNSHTARHGGLDWQVQNFAAAEQPPRSFEGLARWKGGVTLEYHWNNGAPDHIRQGDFDTVVLQGFLPGAKNESIEPFLKHARLLDGVIADSGAETVFFMTWPRGQGDWSTIDDVVTAHRLIADELGAPVAPAALAFERVRAERPDIVLIEDDLTHATWDGAYLAAATVYATLFERSPVGLAYDFGVDAETAAFLQRIAWETVQEWRASG